MKKLVATLILVSFAYFAHSQVQAIKTNGGAWVIKSANIIYEYKVGPSISIGTGIGYKLESTHDIDALAVQDEGDTYQWSGQITPKGVYITPYMRWYPGQAIKGFYIEPFLRYFNYTFEIPYDYEKDNQNRTGIVEGDANGIGGGLGLGVQMIPGGHFVIDIFAGFGLASGKVHMETNDPYLDADDFADIADQIDRNKENEIDVPFLDKVIKNIEPMASSTSAWADIEDELLPMVRAGISLGYAF